MRKRIGNITLIESQKVESDPQRERMRLEFVKAVLIEDSKIRAGKQIQKMCNSERIEDVFKNLFTNSGKPPVNLSIASMVEQYEGVIAKRKWLMAFIQELSVKFKELDLSKYEQYIAEKEQKLKEEEKKREANLFEYTKSQKKLLKPVVREKIREIPIRQQRIYKKKQELDRDELRILGCKRIENTMYCLFTEYIRSPKKELVFEPQKRCEKIAKELEWLEVTVLEMEQRISDLNELIESAHMYMNRISKSYTKNSDWKRVREIEISKDILY
jgi:hypothetical protein